MEGRAQAAEARIAKSSGKAALDHAINAANLYMSAASQASDKAHAARLRHKCLELIAYGEKLKSQLSGAPSGESEILQRVSRLHGNDFPQWWAKPSDSEFQLSPGQKPFVDDAVFTLSPIQTENFAAWTRPQDLFSDDSELREDIKQDAEKDFMQVSSPPDLVQDVTTDCSVVASLSAAIEILTGKHGILSSILYPFDHVNRRPKLSQSGKYILRMNFNGCQRRVVIDDRLPTSKTERTLFVVDRHNPHLIWPALLEKAYLKVRGGYDFPGSNSGTDLWVLTGWIPEQVFLNSEDFDIETTWERIKSAHESQDVVITLGTGRVSAEEERVMGLVGEHDYAVQNVDSSGGSRRLLIKNPWCNGPVWTGAGWSASNTQASAESSRPASPTACAASTSSNLAGTLWVAFEDVAQHFESMYLNWNPSLFPHRQDRHFTWEIPPDYHATSLVQNPQFCLTSSSSGPIWVLVSRHFLDAELDIARNKQGCMADVAQELGYMSIMAFDNHEKRVLVKDEETYQGPLVDSPQTLARLDIKPGRSSIVVVDQSNLALSKYTFTMSVFSHSPVKVQEAADKMVHVKESVGGWNRRTSGGNSGYYTYFQNPQYRLSVPRGGPVSVLLCTGNELIQVHVDVLWARGRRATNVRVKDVVSSSGEYRKGCAVVEMPSVDAGVYTIVCSTFEPGQMADFCLRVSSTMPITLEPVPADTAGMLRTSLNRAPLPHGEERLRAPITSSWLTRASISIVVVAISRSGSDARQPSSVTMRVSVVHGWGANQVVVAESGNGEFENPMTPLRTPEFDMEPDRIRREGMWIVIESLGVNHFPSEVEGEIFSDSAVRVGPWETV